MPVTRLSRQLRIGAAGIGYGGYFQIASWLSHHLIAEHPDLVCWVDYHRTATWFRKGVELLQGGGAEISLINMRGLCAMALRGRGLLDQPFPSLRGLVTFPHPDWSVFAVDPSFQVSSFAEIKARKLPLRLTTGHLNGDNVVGFLAKEILRRHGIGLADIESWGGAIMDGDIAETRAHLSSGQANAIFQEATGHDHWLELFHQRQLVCIPLEEHVAAGLKEDYGWELNTVPAGTYAHQPEPLRTPDASAWILCAAASLPDDVAYSVARIAADHGHEVGAGRVTGAPGVTIAPKIPAPEGGAMADTNPVELHPGAARLYCERGLL